MPLVVRTWNLYHGRTVPASGRTYVERAVRLVTDDRPDVVALQEVPVWDLEALGEWSGMLATTAVARPRRLGEVGRRLTAALPDLVRSGFSGQGNALLLAARHRLAGNARVVELNPGSARERRVCQLVPIEAGARRLVVANLHATAHGERLAREELAVAADALAGEEQAVACGDFNVPGAGLPGFSPPLPGIDQVLVRGLALERPPEPWPEACRRLPDGRLLSDHAPVEAVVA